MEKIICKSRKCVEAKCGASCCKADSQFWGDNPRKCPKFVYAPALYERKESFESVGIHVGEKINRLCNEGKYEEATELENALNIIMGKDYNH